VHLWFKSGFQVYLRFLRNLRLKKFGSFALVAAKPRWDLCDLL